MPQKKKSVKKDVKKVVKNVIKNSKQQPLLKIQLILILI
jgi:hypothetical protein